MMEAENIQLMRERAEEKLQRELEHAERAAQRALNDLNRTLASLDKLEENLERFGDGEEFENGSVLTFTVRFPDGDVHYSYAAIKASDLWYVTGRDTNGMAWRRLVDRYLKRSDDVAYVTEVEEL